tara:strand:- start:537 stop:1181 length:645 start_codon:yes stop_codon:yes gene_type:complete
MLNVDVDLYGKTVHIDILCKIRDDKTFTSMDDTLEQIKVDMCIANILAAMINIPHRVALSFSGGKEACILHHCLRMLHVDFDSFHYKKGQQETPPFVLAYNPTVVHGDMEASVRALDDTHGAVFLGVRRDDFADRPVVYTSTWLEKCNVVCPLYDLDYHTIWMIIDTLGVKVSDLYAEGYTSVGYNSTPNKLLMLFSGGYKHARTFKCVEYERK